jgi:hypothetical protein
MTVTYRRAVEETGDLGSGGGSGGKRNRQPCLSCDTRYDVRIEPREAVVIRVSGRTCRECNPHWRPPPDAPGGRRRIAIEPTRPSGGTPRIETLSENVEDRSGAYLPECPINEPQREEKTEVTERANNAWREAVAPVAAMILAEEERHAVERAWQPEHCEVLEAVAEALDNVWTTAVPLADETTIALRVVDLPAVAAALIVDVADRSTATAREPVALTGELLRFGIVICADSGNAVTCGRLRHELEAVLDVPDEGMVRLLGTGFAGALTASTSELTIHDLLGDLDPHPEPVRVVEEPPAEVRLGPIGRSRVVTASAVDGPSSTATFGF